MNDTWQECVEVQDHQEGMLSYNTNWLTSYIILKDGWREQIIKKKDCANVYSINKLPARDVVEM